MDDARFARQAGLLGRAVIAELVVTTGYVTAVSLHTNLHALEPKT